MKSKEKSRKAEKRRVEERRERVRRKKIQVREMLGTSRNTVFVQWFVGREGRKVGCSSGGCGAMWPDEK